MTLALVRLILIAVFALGTLAGPAAAARADCIGPTFTHPGGDVAHGDTMTVTGYGFGDNCYDTGPPPPGEGALGRPLGDIEVYLEQDGERHLVAVGTADEDYAWEVDVGVPAILDVGAAAVVVTAGGFEAFDESQTEVWVTTAAELEADVEVARFGPPATETTVATGSPEFAGTNWTPVLVLAAVSIGLFGILVVAQRRVVRRGS